MVKDNLGNFASLADPNTSGVGSVGLFAFGWDSGVIGFAGNTGVYGTHVGTSGLKSIDAGVVGDTGMDFGVAGFAPQVGVYGVAHGISGRTPFLAGVIGESDTLTGVIGASGSGEGVKGTGGTNGVHGIGGATGAGVLAENTAGGPALSVRGTGRFSRSGIVTIASPATSATITVPGGLSHSSVVLALLQNQLSGVYVASAVPNVTAGTAAINLNTAAPVGGRAVVGWFVVN
jgi:hypothetical protein